MCASTGLGGHVRSARLDKKPGHRVRAERRSFRTGSALVEPRSDSHPTERTSVEGYHVTTSRYARNSWALAASLAVGLVLTTVPGSFDAASAKPPTKPGRVTIEPLDATLGGNTY